MESIYFDLFANYNVGDAWHELSIQEKERSARFRFNEDRSTYIIVRSNLRKTLSKITGIPPRDLLFDYSSLGKPFLKNHANIHFSVSHCRGAFALAVSPFAPIGIDVESKFRDIQMHNLVELVFTAKERERFDKLSEVEKRSFLIETWTKKEALTKCLGIELVHGMKNYSFSEHGKLDQCIEQTQLKDWFIQTSCMLNTYYVSIAIKFPNQEKMSVQKLHIESNNINSMASNE